MGPKALVGRGRPRAARAAQSARQLPPEARGAWAQTAAHGAAVLYGWAELAGEHGPALRQLGHELALSAEIRAADAQLDRHSPTLVPSRSYARR